jgi:adenylate cyclase
MNSERAKRKLSAILSADVKGFSRLMGEDEVTTVRTLKEYREVMSKLIKEYRGRVVDSPGDNVLAEFTSVVDALECSVEIQQALKNKNAALPDNRKMEFRIGVNLGDVIEDEDRVYGDGVNIAARIEGLADPGGICISGSSFEQVRNKLPLGYQYLGEHTVKNIVQPIKVYRVLMDPESAGKIIGEKEPKQRGWGWKAVAAVAVLVLVAGGLVWNFYIRSPREEPASIKRMAFPLPDKPSIAVLPFDNLSANPQYDSLADGVSENIIYTLSYLPDMFVIARNSTFTYKGKPVKIRQVAEDLGVRYVLEGSVMRADDRVRVTAQLIDATSGYHIWSGRYDRAIKDFFGLLDEITKAIAIELQVKVSPHKIADLTSKTHSFDAWASASKAYGLLMRYGKENILEGHKLAEKALELDPAYGFGWSVVGLAHFSEAVTGISQSPAESLKLGAECCDKALNLDPTLYCANGLKALIYAVQGKGEEAIAHGEKAVAIGPSWDGAYFDLAYALAYTGKFEEAIAPYKKAMRLNPLYPTFQLWFYGISNLMAKHYDEARDVFNELLPRAQKGEFSPLHTHLGLCAAYAELGKEKEASSHLLEALKISPNLSMEGAKKAYPWRGGEYSERWLNSLRKAGLSEKPPLPDKPSIAVLPFVNMSDDPKQEYFSDGMTEDLITDLSKISGLFVIARNSTFVYKGKPVKIRQVAEELGVRYVLEGSVRRAGDQVRINAQLVDGTTGQHLWAERYDGIMRDIFSLQDKINQEIVAALALKLTEGEKAQFSQKWTKNPAAYDEFLKGRQHTSRLTADDYDKAEACYKRALDIDPKFTQARAALASLYLTRAQFGLGKKGYSFYLHDRLRAAQYLREAMREPTPLTYCLSGDMDLLMRMHDAAISKIEKALSLDPNDPFIHGSLSWALCLAGRPAEAMDHAKTAMRLDPINPDRYLYNIGVVQFSLGNMEEAATVLEKALKANPEQTVAAGPLAAAYAQLGRSEEARAACETLRRDWGDAMFLVPGVMYNYPFKDRRVADSLAEGLKKAGMPGGLSDYIHVSKEDQITGDELRAFFYPSRTTGFSRWGGQWSLDRSKDGKLTFNHPGVADTGRGWLEGDKACSQFQSYLLGMADCSTTFKNPKGTFEQKNEYVQFGDYGTSTFSKAR